MTVETKSQDRRLKQAGWAVTIGSIPVVLAMGWLIVRNAEEAMTSGGIGPSGLAMLGSLVVWNTVGGSTLARSTERWRQANARARVAALVEHEEWLKREERARIERLRPAA